MRKPALAALAAVTALSVTGCSHHNHAAPAHPHPSGPAASQPAPPPPVPDTAPTAPDTLPPLPSVIADARMVASTVINTARQNNDSYPSALTLDGQTLTDYHLTLGTGEKITDYRVLTQNGKNVGIRFCVVDKLGPWASYDGGNTGTLLHGLSGPCTFNAAAKPPTGPSKPDVPVPAPHTAGPAAGPRPGLLPQPTNEEQLFGDLAGDAHSAGTQLMSLAHSHGLPKTLEEAVKETQSAIRTTGNSVTGYKLTPKTANNPVGFLLCVSAKLGGWAQFDSTQPTTLTTGNDGTCGMRRLTAPPPPKLPATPATPSTPTPPAPHPPAPRPPAPPAPSDR